MHRINKLFLLASLVALIASPSCGGGNGTEGDAEDDTAADTAGDTAADTTPDTSEDTPEDTTTPDTPEDTPEDTPTDGSPFWDELGTNNQDITGVERVIFLGDSITATPYLTSPWSDRIRADLRSHFGDSITFQNYAEGGARTEHIRDDQLPRIDTSSSATTLVMFTIGGNDALQVMGEAEGPSMAHMETKVAILEEILEWLADASHFPGGVYVVFSNIYDPTDGEGDFTHCGIGVYGEDWPIVGELAPVVNEMYLDLANEYGFDLLDMYGLFAGHGFNNDDPTNPFYCNGCTPDCPCPRWFDFTCIHPNADGHTALAGFFYGIVTR